MAALTETERLAWERATERAHEERRRYCTSPVTPATPIVPTTPGWRRSLRGDTLPKR